MIYSKDIEISTGELVEPTEQINLNQDKLYLSSGKILYLIKKIAHLQPTSTRPTGVASCLTSRTAGQPVLVERDNLL